MRNLDENELADRWDKSPRTLQGWRQQGKGPRYLKIGAHVLYPLEEIEAYEAANLHANTNGPLIDGNESGLVDNAEPMSIGDKKATGRRTAGRSGPSQPRPPPAASQPQAAPAPTIEQLMTKDIEIAAQKATALRASDKHRRSALP